MQCLPALTIRAWQIGLCPVVSRTALTTEAPPLSSCTIRLLRLSKVHETLQVVTHPASAPAHRLVCLHQDARCSFAALLHVWLGRVVAVPEQGLRHFGSLLMLPEHQQLFGPNSLAAKPQLSRGSNSVNSLGSAQQPLKIPVHRGSRSRHLQHLATDAPLLTTSGSRYPARRVRSIGSPTYHLDILFTACGAGCEPH